RHVAVPPRLADVVEQHAEHQKLGLLDLAEDARGALRLRGLTGRQRLEVLDGEQRVLVRGELMVDIVLHQARERAELREIAAEELQLVHLGKRRSEEHTSELQSRGHLVCRLLLEKKKNK